MLLEPFKQLLGAYSKPFKVANKSESSLATKTISGGDAMMQNITLFSNLLMYLFKK